MVVAGMMMVAVMVLTRRKRRRRDHDHHDEKQRQKLFHVRHYSRNRDRRAETKVKKNHGQQYWRYWPLKSRKADHMRAESSQGMSKILKISKESQRRS
jgi:hypothetical protein